MPEMWWEKQWWKESWGQAGFGVVWGAGGRNQLSEELEVEKRGGF